MSPEGLLDFLSEHMTALGVAVFVGVAFWRVNLRSRQTKVAAKLLKKAVETEAVEPLSLHPEVDPVLCAGCASCVRVCPEGNILQILDHKAVLVAPTKCVGHGECELSCPTGAIRLVFGTKTRGMDIPRITTHYETNVPGLYVAGELGGMGLIRNAIKQGHLAATHALTAAAKTKGKADVDLLIVGAGPAGLAAALTAIAGKKSYQCVEQGSFGGTVYNFPRQKVVMTHPADLPIIGRMKFAGNKVTKEELLEYWNDVRTRTGLRVSENVRFETVEPQDDVFVVKTSAGLVRARKVILCMGVRGSPRKLGLKNEALPKVAYNLLDPEQYQGRNIAVVGGGNAAVEAAQYLGKAEYQNTVTLLVRGKVLERCNEDNRNIVMKMAEQGRVQIWWNASVKEIGKDSLVVDRDKTPVVVPNDYLFIFAGAEMPHKFLMGLGVQIDRKFGEALSKGPPRGIDSLIH